MSGLVRAMAMSPTDDAVLAVRFPKILTQLSGSSFHEYASR